MSLTKSIALWVLAVVLMAALAVYQRMTGPTYPITGDIELNGNPVSYKLLTTYDGDDDASLLFKTEDETISGKITYKRFPSNDEWTTAPLIKTDTALIAKIPHQPPAGKVEYTISMTDASGEKTLTEQPVVIRYKGAVPGHFLWPHVLLMFLAMCFSMRTGFEAMFKGRGTKWMTYATVVLLFFGGIIMGPVIQKYAFGAYWTGWPFGHDLTDNKTLVAFIFWLIAVWKLKKNPENRAWPIIAAVILLAVYLIPHSVLGSEIDYTKMPQ